MKLKLVFGLLGPFLWVAAGWWLLPAAAQTPRGSRLTVLSSNAQEIVLELTVADFTVEAMELDGPGYQRLVIPGTVQTEVAGAPQLPTRGALLGIPTTAGVAVEILASDTETLDSFRLPPAPTPATAGDSRFDGGITAPLIQDPAIYNRAAFYPDSPVALGQPALLRDQPVVALHLYPVQYHPVSGQIKLHRRLVVRLTWPQTAGASAETRAASPAFETLLQTTLLNYDSVSRPPSKKTFPLTRAIAPAAISPTLKIGVTQNGLYQLTTTDLLSAGFDPGTVDPRTLRLSSQGQDIPLEVLGETDGVFDPTDTIRFYGRAITDAFTTENVYWLTAGDTPGLRMSRRDGSPTGSAPLPAHFPVTRHAEENHYYWQTMPNGAGQDHWFWEARYTAPVSKSYIITLANPSTAAATATVRMALHGTTAASATPDHHTRLYLNGHLIDEQWWDGQVSFTHRAEVPHSYLLAGSNTLQLEAVGDTGAAVDQWVTNWLEVDYWNATVAENDQLLFGAPEAGSFQFKVTGFTTNTVALFDVTNADTPAVITGATLLSAGESYTLQFEDITPPGGRYLALTPGQFQHPFRLELEQPSAWKTTTNGADYVIITHPDFYTSTLPLADHRRAAGLQVATVKVDDIYDEFNGGIFNPQAIRDFLSYTYNHWTPAPTYVLLVGDATYDTQDYTGTGKQNYIPAPIVETDDLGQTPSDNWYVTVSGTDILPDMFIGRLSANSAAQADAMVNRIIGYAQHPPAATWLNQALLVADDDPEFESLSEQLATLLPAVVTTTRVYASHYPPGDPTVDINTRINGGSLLVNYAGHGNSLRWGSWSDGRIYEWTDILALNNGEKLPLVTLANCLNGFFTSPYETDTLLPVAEAFQRASNGGAVAVWAPTGLGYPSGHRALMTEFYQSIFPGSDDTLGAATTAAKVAIAGQNPAWDELVDTYVFFGDPAMRLAGSPAGGPANTPIFLPLLLK